MFPHPATHDHHVEPEIQSFFIFSTSAFLGDKATRIERNGSALVVHQSHHRYGLLLAFAADTIGVLGVIRWAKLQRELAVVLFVLLMAPLVIDLIQRLVATKVVEITPGRLAVRHQPPLLFARPQEMRQDQIKDIQREGNTRQVRLLAVLASGRRLPFVQKLHSASAADYCQQHVERLIRQ